MTTHKEALEQANYAYCRTPSSRSNKDMEAAIRAYLDARGLVMVPKEPTSDMHDAWELGYYNGYDSVDAYEALGRETAFKCFKSAHEAMIAAAPEPFK